jgi:lysophospholipid acyltransferase (LPLAT)-like uncharacterized protein
LTQTPAPAKPSNRNALHRRMWRNVRTRIQSSDWFGNGVATLVTSWFGLVNRTNKLVPGSDTPEDVFAKHAPAIYTMWHGQHFMVPFLMPKGAKLVAMLSRSADAEINARMVEKFGVETVRGSGGREPSRSVEKGGARALIQLKRSLDQGKSVFMIADISKAEARHAGLGIVLLAKLSGRPIVAVAYKSTRKHVIEKTWDKTTLNLPFGKAAAVAGEPIYVPSDASDADLETFRAAVDRSLNDAAERATSILETAR